MNRKIVEPLHAAGALSDLDRSFARLMARLSGPDDGALELAAALVSRASAEGNICLELTGYAGASLAGGKTTLRCPDFERWVSALRKSPVVGAPGDWRPLVLDGTRLYLYRHWEAEQSLARLLRERSQAPAAGVDIPQLREGLKRLFARGDGSADWQAVAAAVAVLKRLCVITGGPGTGKTTTVARILALLLEQTTGSVSRIALAAPTGKAAARLQDAIREAAGGLVCADGIRARLAGMEASTLHRLLGRRRAFPSLVQGDEEPLPYDAVVVDEASMVSQQLLYGLVRPLPAAARLILLGDRDQLASVEAGAVLGDICGPDRKAQYSGPFGEVIAAASGQSVPLTPPGEIQPPVGDCIVELRRNYRFGAESGIGALARAINERGADEALSILHDKDHGDLGWRRVPKPRDLPRAMREIVLAGCGDYRAAETPAAIFERFSRFRVLCALREGPYGSGSLNAAIEGILAREGYITPGRPWYEGRPVMVTRNDYGLRLFNGDIGIALADPESGTLRVFFPAPDGALREFEPYRLPEHETAFAMTIHKSQGTEFDRVLLVLPEGDARVLTRELLYTGVTRARRRVDLWAGEAALLSALSRRTGRVSGLRDALWRV
jgi:exodeoxyribonuclease V alpha subunit